MTHGSKNMAWTVSKLAPGAAALALLLVIVSLVVGLPVAGCAPLIAGTSDPAHVKTIMQATHARGCIYARASAAPWAQVTTILVGTWGEKAPTYEDCWKGLPAGIP